MLGRAGLLDSLTITTFHQSIESLRETVPSATVLDDARFVDNGRIITTAGISAGIDGALHLVGRIRGEAAVERIVRQMEYDAWRPGRGVIVQQK